MGNDKKYFDHSPEEIGEGTSIVLPDPIDMIPVPLERYTELIKKEVELDLVYALCAAGEKYKAFDLIEAMIGVRYGRDKAEEN